MIRRMAYQVAERNSRSASLVIAGIVKKGVPLAEVLADEIGKIDGRSYEAHPLDVQLYRDDVDAGDRPSTPPLPEKVDDRDVLLVDDVLFTGRTARAAIDAVVSQGRPNSIQLAVLIDRGHREYPIQPDYVGRTIPTKHQEDVVVRPAGDRSFSVHVEE